MRRCIKLGSLSLCGKVPHGFRFIELQSRRKAKKKKVLGSRTLNRTLFATELQIIIIIIIIIIRGTNSSLNPLNLQTFLSD
jgi:hypothetical protein